MNSNKAKFKMVDHWDWLFTIGYRVKLTLKSLKIFFVVLIHIFKTRWRENKGLLCLVEGHVCSANRDDLLITFCGLNLSHALMLLWEGCVMWPALSPWSFNLSHKFRHDSSSTELFCPFGGAYVLWKLCFSTLIAYCVKEFPQLLCVIWFYSGHCFKLHCLDFHIFSLSLFQALILSFSDGVGKSYLLLEFPLSFVMLQVLHFQLLIRR